MPAVLALGDTLVEVSVLVADAWDSSPDVPASSRMVSAGGSAANFAAFTAALGVRSLLATEVGDDAFADLLLDDLHRHSIDTTLVRRHAGDNSLCVITVGHDGDRRFVSYRGGSGTDDELRVSDYRRLLLDSVPQVDWIHISGFWLQRDSTAELALAAAAVAQRQGIPVSVDPSPRIMESPPQALLELLSITDVFFPNAYEACAFTGAPDAPSAARALRALGIRHVVVTDGAAGSILVESDLIYSVASIPGRVVDTTGAGDALAAGFVASRLAGIGASQALERGTQAASLAIETIGGHTAAEAMGRTLGREIF